MTKRRKAAHKRGQQPALDLDMEVYRARAKAYLDMSLGEIVEELEATIADEFRILHEDNNPRQFEMLKHLSVLTTVLKRHVFTRPRDQRAAALVAEYRQVRTDL